MMDDVDPGVSLTATSLVNAMCQDELEAFEGCYEKAVKKLDRIVFDGDYPAEYVYYKVSWAAHDEIYSQRLMRRYRILGYKSNCSG